MSTLLIIVVIIAVIIALALIAAAVTGKEMNVERSITINKPLPQVFDYVRYLRNHEHFNVWATMDPDMKKEYRGTDGQPGCVFAWDSSKKRNVGAGEQEIKNIEEGKSIEHELRFIRPMQDVANGKFVFEPVSATASTLQWQFYSQMKFPMNVMKPMIRSMLGKNLEASLQNLKSVLER